MKSCVTLYLTLLLIWLSQAEALACMSRYPTQWHIHNSRNNQVQLACRVYHGGWSTQSVRELQLSVPAGAYLNHTFPDHNDGVGMIQRNWSCAAGTGPHPLMETQPDGFGFRGCPNTTLQIPTATGSTWAGSLPSPTTGRQAEGVHHCPEVHRIQRLHSCDDPRCQWDEYGANVWQGVSTILTDQELADLSFIGVDASKNGENALGCVYYAATHQKTLILLSYLPPKPSTYPEFRFKPQNIADFNVQRGYLRQCFGTHPQDCPLVVH
ncbi:MAG: hypothetical protein OXT67_03935 [Zetaproteobacteria bacterium]|nr:hypothetical protein [Zetaproteobacteria bacterium]